ncbi:Ski oncogene [Liparis tanakae]|uniref:Ski oncogene n=1 Tax=Liparis tanakae TaxID=230148 RepID=A0A4Z2J154_9TELE|nr:Ski oncogene [Liparis tanakae]
MSYHLAQWDLLGSRMCEEGVMTAWPCYVYDVVALSPVPAKRSKFDKLQSPSADKDRKPDWLQSLSKSAQKDLKQVQMKQRPSAFRPWSPKATEKEKPGTQNEVERSYSKSHETLVEPNPTPAPLAPPVPLHNGDTQPALKPPPSSTAKQHEEDMDTDGEIDVDDCDDRPVPASSLACLPSACTKVPQTLTPQGVARPQEGPDWLPGTVCPEMDTLRQMLYGGADTKDAREKLLQEIVKLRVKQEEKLAAALQAKRSLQQVFHPVPELEFVRVAKKGRLLEAIEAKRNLRKEIERLRVDWERKMREAEESCGRLKRELERERQLRVCDKGCEAERLRVKYSTQIEELHLQLQQAEADREQLRQELQQEREARQSLESVVKDLQSQLALQADRSPPGDPKDANTDTHRQNTQHTNGS